MSTSKDEASRTGNKLEAGMGRPDRVRKKKKKRQRKHAGLPPGTVWYTGELREEPSSLHATRYNTEGTSEERISADTLPAPPAAGEVQWIRMEGVHDTDTVQRIGEHYGLHALTLEDITNTVHRPKLEIFDDYLLVILHHLRRDESDVLVDEQIALVLTGSTVISFSTGKQEVFDPNRERIAAPNGRFRARGADYLFYTLIDSVVDHYVLMLESIDDNIEDREEEVLSAPTPDTIAALHDLRRILMQLRRAVLPLRDVLMQLRIDEHALISSDISVFLHDVQDHLNQVMDTIESDRESISGLIELYMTHESNRMNEVMKVLTIIATVFIPLTFIAGVYGMNFHHMPELQFPWAYPAVLGLMLLVAIVMFIYFRRKHWL